MMARRAHSGDRAMNPDLAWWCRFAAAELRWFNFVCDRIVSEAIKRHSESSSTEGQ